jgi:hypothetical protein
MATYGKHDLPDDEWQSDQLVDGLSRGGRYYQLDSPPGEDDRD